MPRRPRPFKDRPNPLEVLEADEDFRHYRFLRQYIGQRIMSVRDESPF